MSEMFSQLATQLQSSDAQLTELAALNRELRQRVNELEIVAAARQSLVCDCLRLMDQAQIDAFAA